MSMEIFRINQAKNVFSPLLTSVTALTIERANGIRRARSWARQTEVKRNDFRK